jgi:hypothetical protein
MAFHGFSQFNAVAIVRCQEIRTDEQEDNRRSGQMSINLLDPISSCDNLAIMPFGDDPLLSQETQVCFQLLSQSLVSMRIGVEDRDRGCRYDLLFHCRHSSSIDGHCC